MAAVGFASDVKVVHAFVLGEELKPFLEECVGVVGSDRIIGREASRVVGVRKPYACGALQVNDVGVLVPRSTVLPSGWILKGPCSRKKPYLQTKCVQ